MVLINAYACKAMNQGVIWCTDMFAQHTYKRVTVLAVSSAALLLGLALGYATWSIATAIVVISLMTTIILRHKRLFIISLAVFALALGIWRGAGARVSLNQGLAAMIGDRVVVQGIISDDPATTAKQTNFTLDNIQIAGHLYPGQIAVTSYHLDVRRGYLLRLEGVLKTGFATKAASLGFAKITVLSYHQNTLEVLRQRFFSGMYTALPEPLASLALGLLIGARALIPKWLQTQLAAVGLSHLVAVSGYNLTIITAAAYRVLKNQSRNLGVVIMFWLIGSFVIIAGPSASVVRAAIVAVLTILASSRGRKFAPLGLVGIVASATAFVSPISVVHDLSWQLSFLAFLGIAVVAPVVAERLKLGDKFLPRLAIDALCAQALTWPLIAYVFHQFSVVAIVANILIMPIVPMAMAASFIAGLAGTLVPFMVGWFAWPATILLQWLLACVAWLSNITGIVIPTTLSGLGLFWSYALLSVIASLILRKSSGQPARYSDIIDIDRSVN